MSENSLASTIAGAIITTGLTLLGTSLLQGRESDRANHAKFLDGAQATAQETSKLLAEGYSALETLTQDSSKSEGSAAKLENVRKYDEFYRGWRQRLIENQFRVSRYFGATISANIIHLKEIEVAKIHDPAAPEPCTLPGIDDSLDMNKLAERIRCLVTISAFWDRRQQSVNPHDLDEQLTLERSRSINTENIRRQMISYEASYVRILRGLDDRFSALGAKRVL
ncbi:Uncharacterized protein ALO71_01198 [Pseudomonas amygdali pv. dendropanacis]|uniref:Uncharacterized protein n=1 Tax=Pseudomonas amygdali pv. dendropanacis TaxID=235272 RepID=A0A0P9S1T4_PSEA0|nr:hypothetical protein [Pseudomonas amygdali]KPX19192.1 Uncharacterized protein ALO71_01198 [Pseudomonas amygdali pv. dendropanacis]KWS74867.1 hypothetical protein AL051_11265 [Pseudomonas amygdali pv. dendropanacis]